jgi:hypothetical protein
MRSLSPKIPSILSKFFLATRAERRSSPILGLFVRELGALKMGQSASSERPLSLPS